jgi:hypothetical protein
VSHLEEWISDFVRQAGKGGSPLKQHPALPWIRLTQLGFQGGCTRVSLQTSYRHIRFDLENWHPQSGDLQMLDHFPAEASENPLGQALQLLLAYKPTALSVAWQAGETSGAWVLRGDAARQSYPAPHRRVDALMVHVSWKPNAVSAWRAMERRHKSILDEYLKRTCFAARPILLQGRQAPGDLELGHVQSRQHVVMAVIARPQEDSFAVAPPIIYNPMEVTYNGSPLHCGQVGSGLSGPTRVNHYYLKSEIHYERVVHDCSELTMSRKNLDHPDLLVAYDSNQAPGRFERVALAGTGSLLLPARRVGPSWMIRYSIRPYRVTRFFCLPTQEGTGPSRLVPIRHGVCLAPLPLQGLPKNSLILAVCPGPLRTDANGLQLIADEACQQWTDELLAEAREIL